MRSNIFLIICAAVLLMSCTTMQKAGVSRNYPFKRDTLNLSDASRNRKIPIALYHPEAKRPKVIIFSHRYGHNKGGDYLAYSYLTEFLAAKGYFVVSIQHELPSDELMPRTGIPQVVRRPFWERGAVNIFFVINQLKKSHPELNFNDLTLIGHSNGADMTALFPQLYPGMASRIITLDNRRMPFPLYVNLKVYSLRSNDQPADQGVIPEEAEIQKWKITLIKLQDVKHDDMDDHATESQRKEIQDYLLQFLKA